MSDITVTQQGNQLRIQFPYDPDTVDTVKLVPGKKWNRVQRWWAAPVSSLPFVMTHFPGANYVGPIASQVKKHFQFWSRSSEVDDLNGSAPERPLFAFQHEGVLQARRLDRALIGDQMGLGKTCQAIVLAQLRDPKRVLVLCPASLKLNWAKEISMAYPGDSIGIGYGSYAKWVIESYDTAWRKRASETLSARTFDAALLDEIQLIKNPDAKRSQGAYDLVSKIPVRYGLTGTPMENRPIDLVGVLIALGYLSKGSRWGFMNRYCFAGANQWGNDYTGAINLDELHKVLKFFMIRRLKSEVLQDLPPKVYTDDVFSIAKSSDYWDAEKSYRQFVRALKFGAATATKVQRQSQLMTLGRQAALAKVDYAEERVGAALESGLKVLFFSTYRQPIEELARRFGPSSVSFTGEMPPDIRANLIRKFQENDFIRVAFCTTGAGGTGHNMTAANIVMFLDQPWNPSKKQQAEDRAHRIGQDRGLQVVNLIAEGTIDERMVEMNARKHRVVSQAIEGEVSDFEGEEGLLQELENYYAC